MAKIKDDLKQTEYEASVDHPQIAKKKYWSPGEVFFGLLFITVGTLFLLQNIGMIDFDIHRIWQLWPLLIIAAGLSLIPVRGWIATSIMALFIAGALALVALVALGIISPDENTTTTTRTAEVSRQDNNIKDASVLITTGSGKITIGSENIDQLVRASLESNATSLRQRTRVENGSQTVELNVEGDNEGWRGGDLKNDLTVTLGRSVPIRLILNTGASTLDADLSEVNLSQLTIKTGASRSEIKLGNQSDSSDVSIEAGMSSIKLLIPRSSGLRLDVESPMSGLDIPQLKEVSKNVYENDAYSTASKKITIKSQTGMASLSVAYY